MNKKNNSGTIINSINGELKPVDYSRIEKLRQSAGVTQEYLQKIERNYEKTLSNKAKEK